MIFRYLFLLALTVFFSSEALAAEWQERKTEHFIVYYKKAPARFIGNVLLRAEENYRRTTTTLGFTRYKGWSWNGRVKIYIYDDAQDYKSASGNDWAAGSVMTRFKEIRTYPAAYGFFEATLPHETGHIIFRDFIGPDAVVPLWFEEGVAMYQEESGRREADEEARKALREGRFIALPDLMRLELNRDSDRELVRIFYVEAASLVSFLINDGEVYRFARLCRELKDRVPFDGALKKSYMKYPGIEMLEAAWKGYLIHEKKERH